MKTKDEIKRELRGAIRMMEERRTSGIVVDQQEYHFYRGYKKALEWVLEN